MSGHYSARVIHLRLEKLRRGLLVNTALLEQELDAPRGSLTRCAAEFSNRCPGHAGNLQRIRDSSFDLDIDQFYTWTHLGIIRPAGLGFLLRSRATSMAARASYTKQAAR